MKFVLFVLAVASVVVACGGRCTDSSCPPSSVPQACSDIVEAICTRRVDCGVASDVATCTQTVDQQAACSTATCPSGTSYDETMYEDCRALMLAGSCSAKIISGNQLDATTVGCSSSVFCK